MMTLLYTGALPTSETPAPLCQPVITSFEGVFMGLGGEGHAYITFSWTAEQAEYFKVYIDDQLADTYLGNETYFSLAFGETHAIKLEAYCGDLMAEETLNYFVDPCYGSSLPIISIFNITQANDTGAVTFYWEATEIDQADIYNNNVLVATSTDMVFIELTANGTLRGGSLTIPQPSELGLQNFTLKAMGGSALCFAEDTQSIDLVSALDLSFTRLGQYQPNRGAYHIIHYDYFKGVTIAPLNLTSNGDFSETTITDDYGEVVDLTDINLAPLANYTNPFTLYFTALNFVPSGVASNFEVGMINNQLALKVIFVQGTTGQSVAVDSFLAARGDIFMTLNEDAGLSPLNPTSAATISSATGLIPANGQHGDYGSQQILPLFTPNSNGDIWMSFQVKTHATYHTPNHATVALFTYNTTNSEDYGVKIGSSVPMTGLKYRQFSNHTITVIGGYVNKAALTSQAAGSPYYVTVDSVSWY